MSQQFERFTEQQIPNMIALEEREWESQLEIRNRV
jgi:hypothetical protein